MSDIEIIKAELSEVKVCISQLSVMLAELKTYKADMQAMWQEYDQAIQQVQKNQLQQMDQVWNEAQDIRAKIQTVHEDEIRRFEVLSDKVNNYLLSSKE